MKRRTYLAAVAGTGTVSGCLRLADDEGGTPLGASPTDEGETPEGTGPTGTAGSENSETAVSVAGDWPQFQYDAAHTGHTPSTAGPTGDVAVAWTFERKEPVPDARSREAEWPFFNPVVADGAVHVASQDDNVYAIDAATGTERWRHSNDVSEEDLGRKCTPAVVDGVVFSEGSGGYLYAVDATSGRRRWLIRTRLGPYPAAPTVVDDTVYVADGRTLAVDATNGSLRWEWERGDPGLAVADGTVFTTDNDDRAFDALDAATGERLWTVDVHTHIPTVVDGTVLASTRTTPETDQRNRLYAFAAADGTVRWEVDLPGPASHSPAVASGTAFLGAAGGTLFALDVRDGQELWRYDPVDAAGIPAPPAVAGGHVYYGDGDGWVHCLTVDGEKKWMLQVGETAVNSPAVADGVVFVGTRSGTVSAIRGRS